MPYRRKDSPVWWVSFIGPDSKRVRRSTGTTDRKEAEALEAKWKLEAYRTRQWNEKPALIFDELMVHYLNATQSEKRSADRDRLIVKALRKHFAGVEMLSIQGADIRAYIARRRSDGVSEGTINRELACLSAAINFGRRELGYDMPNPVSGRKLRQAEGRVRWITRAEAEALIRAAAESKSPHLVDFIRLALHTGMRRGEILGLEWRRVDLQTNLIYLEAQHTKAGKRRSVPLNAVARDAILSRARFRAAHCPASPWVFADKCGNRICDIKRSFATACRRAGIEDFRIHDLRHTCAAWLVGAGVPLTEVRDLLGHSTVKMTEKYAHLAPENLREAVTKLEELSRFGHAEGKTGAEKFCKELI